VCVAEGGDGGGGGLYKNGDCQRRVTSGNNAELEVVEMDRRGRRGERGVWYSELTRCAPVTGGLWDEGSAWAGN
jgi:hypothetical protein